MQHLVRICYYMLKEFFVSRFNQFIHRDADVAQPKTDAA